MIPYPGGATRLMLAGDFNWPTEIRFSPDGSKIAAIANFGLVIIDVITGHSSSPRYLSNGAIHPCWGPDSRKLAYERRIVGAFTPPESTGFRIIDTATGEESQLLENGNPVFGSEAIWPPSGGALLLLTSKASPFGAEIDAFDLATSLRTIVADGGPGSVLQSLRWYSSGATGLFGLVFTNASEPGAGTYIVRPDGGTPTLFPYASRWVDAFSPDGSEIVTEGVSLEDGSVVLFLRSIDDPGGSTMRQLTHSRPPGPVAAVPNAKGSPTMGPSVAGSEGRQ